MRIMLRNQLKRKVEEDKDSEFSVHGQGVAPDKMERFMKRKAITKEEILEYDKREYYFANCVSADNQNTATPKHITCHSPAEDRIVKTTQGKQRGLSQASEEVLGTITEWQMSGFVDLQQACAEKSVQVPVHQALRRVYPVEAAEASVCQAAKSPRINLLSDSPFERFSPRYHISSSPSWYQGAITPSNPLSLLSPFSGTYQSTPKEDTRKKVDKSTVEKQIRIFN